MRSLQPSSEDSRSISRGPVIDDEAYEEESDISNLFKSGEDTEPLSATSYDGVVLAVTSYMDETYCAEHGSGPSLMQLVLVSCLHIFSVSIQIVLIIYLLVSVVQKHAEPYRHGLDDRSAALRTAISGRSRLPLSDPALFFCNQLSTLRFAHETVMFLWSTRMLAEFKDTLQRMLHICSLASCNTLGHGKVEEYREDGRLILVAVTKPLKCLLVLVVCLPQAICAMVLYWLGAKFLYFSYAMDILVMKSVSLSFITQMDELIFAGYASMSFKARIAGSSYKVERERPGRHWSLWGSMVFELCLTIGSTAAVVYGVFGPITEHREMCHDYFQLFPGDTPDRGSESVWTTLLKGLELA